MSNNQSPVLQILQLLFSCFCSGNQQQGQQQQQQQHYPQQQQQYQSHPQPSYPPPQHQQYQQQASYGGQLLSTQPPPNVAAFGQIINQKYRPGGQDNNMANQANPKYMEMRDAARAAHNPQERNRLNDEARDWIYFANNTDSPPGTIDLHGLYVNEAMEKSEAEIKNAKQTGSFSQLKFIAGKGNHSAGHVAKIRPALEELLQKEGIQFHEDPHNIGVVIANLR